jgi:hypothetical protein
VSVAGGAKWSSSCPLGLSLNLLDVLSLQDTLGLMKRQDTGTERHGVKRSKPGEAPAAARPEKIYDFFQPKAGAAVKQS